ncbi:LacI family transcriptional regulator [Oscillospiraceae bacterium HV4-5-C5C]|nr:LacI family transcriptional regulator [Oscillospiraceae bacterium HV4-5-C5C]
MSEDKLSDSKKPVILKDIAEACGVSVATVSKALNGHRDVSESTRQHICLIAADMGYLPNSAALRLKTNRSFNLGVLFDDQANSGLTHNFFSRILDSLKRQAEQRGYDITFLSQNIGQMKMSYYDHAVYRGCDGVVIACVDYYSPEILQLIKSEIPVVTIDHSFHERTSVLSNNVDGMRDLTAYIISCGYQRIAYVHGEDTAVTRSRVGSFYRTCEERGLAVPDAYLIAARYHNTGDSAQATRQLMALDQPPDCIIYPDDYSSLGGRWVLDKMKLSVPDDIGIAGFDGLNFARVLDPELTTVRQDTEEMGKAAANQVIDEIERPRSAIPHQILVNCQLIKGGSVAVRPAAPVS